MSDEIGVYLCDDSGFEKTLLGVFKQHPDCNRRFQARVFSQNGKIAIHIPYIVSVVRSHSC